MITRTELIGSLVDFYECAGFYPDLVEKELSAKSDEELRALFDEYHLTVF